MAKRFEQLYEEEVKKALSKVLSTYLVEFTGNQMSLHIQDRVIKCFIAELQEYSSLVEVVASSTPNSSLESVKCPDCGGEMISRKGTYGTFWGCKSYPECRGTRDSQGRSKADREDWKAKQKGESYEKDDKDETNRFSFKKTN